MKLRHSKSRQARAVDKLRRVGGRRKSKPARMAGAVRDTVTRSGPAKTVRGAGRAAGRSGQAVAAHTGRKAAGKRAPLLVGLPVLAGASIASVVGVRKMRRGIKETAPAS